MIDISIRGTEAFNEETNEFIEIPECVLTLEHSLISISKWESRWHKPFLDKRDKTREETIDYIKCMTINKNVPAIVYDFLSNDVITKVNAYISNPMTATVINKKRENTAPSTEPVTSEMIYYWMISLNIPVEFEKWHLNRLLTLIQVCNIKNTPHKKMNPTELAKRNTALNAARLKRYHTRG